MSEEQFEILLKYTSLKHNDLGNIVFFVVKALLVMVFAVTMVRVSIARLRISEVVSTYWVAITLMALLGLVLLMWDSQVLTISWW